LLNGCKLRDVSGGDVAATVQEPVDNFVAEVQTPKRVVRRRVFEPAMAHQGVDSIFDQGDARAQVCETSLVGHVDRPRR
jgi:hypothetical protein